MDIIQKPIQHFNDRKEKIEFLIIHCMAFDIDKCYEVFDEFEVSAHYVIEESGKIYQLVDEEKRAYHAGLGFWNGIDKDLNSRSIGIELESKTLGQSPYSDAQLTSLMNLSKDIMKRHNIKSHNVIAHSDIAPDRKPDPGIAFPWQDFANNVIGIWFDINNAKKIEKNDAKTLLSMIGYDVRDDKKLIASANRFNEKYIKNEVENQNLHGCFYPFGDDTILKNKTFLKTLKAVAFEYQKIRTK